MNPTKRSPLKGNSLRMPGQSVYEEIKKVLHDEVDPLLLFPLILITFAFFEWCRWYFAFPSNPILMIVMALGAAFYSAYRYWVARNESKH